MKTFNPFKSSGQFLGGSIGRSRRIQRAICRGKTTLARVASGGGLKNEVLEAIIDFMKNEFLEAKTKKLTIEQLLREVKAEDLSDDVVQWLVDDALPNHPRARVMPSGRFGYKPPLACLSGNALLKILKQMQANGDGGLLRSLVEDSMPTADQIIEKLAEEGKILQVTRLDKEEILFYKQPDPELDGCVMNGQFVELWRRVDIANKGIEHIRLYLRNQRISVFDDEKFDKDCREEEEEGEQAATGKRGRKRKVKLKAASKKRARRKIRDNAHVEEQLDLDLIDRNE